MRISTPNRIAMVVAGGIVVGCLHAAPAGAAAAGTWTVTGTTTVRYRYERHHGRAESPFATHLVLHDDGTIEGEVTEPQCGSPPVPVSFSGRWTGNGAAGIAAALRSFVSQCYDVDGRLRGVESRVHVSADGAHLRGAFGARLRLPYGDRRDEAITVRLRGVLDGRREN
jgi:hypothetical protein